MYSVSTESSSILKDHQVFRINSNQEIRGVRETEDEYIESIQRDLKKKDESSFLKIRNLSDF